MEEAPQVLAEILNRQRDTFNARFALARSRKRALSPVEWQAVLRECVAPLAFAVWQSQPERADAVVEAAYEAALELLARDQLGPRSDGAMLDLWRVALPLLAPVVAASPRRTLGRTCNALLAMRSHGLGTLWARRLRALAADGAFAHCDADAFERALLVLAWRCGLAHARGSALQYLRAMPPALARSVLGAPHAAEGEWPRLLERLEREPFWNPSRAEGASAEGASGGEPTLRFVAQVGEWAGWGGAMDEPPRVLRRRGALWAWSGRAWWRLHADAFGATLSPARFDTAPANLPPELQRDESCGAWKIKPQKIAGEAAGESVEALQVTHGPNTTYAQAQSAVLRGFGGVLSAASDESVLAFTTPLSLRVFVVARAPST